MYQLIKRSSTLSKVTAAAVLITVVPQFSFASVSTVLTRVREGYFLIAGFPSSIVSNGPPQDGLISLMDYFSTQAQTIAMANGVGSCAAIPASGSAAGTITVPSALSPFIGATGAATVSYETPVVTAPLGWNGAGSLFAKRVKITRTGGVAFAMEFNCATNELFTSFALPGDNIAGSNRDINLYIKKNGANLAADFFMTVTISSRTTVVDSQAVRLETTDGVSFKVWNTNVTMRDSSYTCSGSPCSDQFGYERAVIQGNSVTRMGSLYAKFDKPSLAGATTVALKKALVSDSSSATVAVSSFDFSASEPNQGQNLEKSGCVNFLTQADPATGSYCVGAGASLAAASSAPLADATGSFTVNWVKTTLLSRMFFAN